MAKAAINFNPVAPTRMNLGAKQRGLERDENGLMKRGAAHIRALKGIAWRQESLKNNGDPVMDMKLTGELRQSFPMTRILAKWKDNVTT